MWEYLDQSISDWRHLHKEIVKHKSALLKLIKIYLGVLQHRQATPSLI